MRTKVDKARVVVCALYGPDTHMGGKVWPRDTDPRVRKKARLPMAVLDDQYERACKVLGPLPALLPESYTPAQ
jgi:hypothetical protein